MNCPSCGAPMRLQNGNTSLRCDYCKTVVTLAPDDAGIQYLDESPDLECPTCAVSLWSAVMSSVPLHACKRCRGLLVPMASLEPLIEATRAKNSGGEIPPPADAADLDRKVTCPRCRHRMESEFYSGGGNVIVSGCERNELNWLDGGVLLRIVLAANASGAEAAF